MQKQAGRKKYTHIHVIRAERARERSEGRARSVRDTCETIEVPTRSPTHSFARTHSIARTKSTHSRIYSFIESLRLLRKMQIHIYTPNALPVHLGSALAVLDVVLGKR